MSIKIFSLIFLIAFGFSQQSGSKKAARLDAEFSLRVGQKAHIKSEGLNISFSSVTEDSRCPVGVDCIWAGNAAVAVKLSKAKGDSASVNLNTDLDPKERSFEQYVITLTKLSPYPKKDSSIKKEDYVATFVVRKTSR